MEEKKNFYRGLNFNGYKWQGFWKKFHHFVKKEDRGYLEIKCTDEDIKNGNLKLMTQYGWSK